MIFIIMLSFHPTKSSVPVRQNACSKHIQDVQFLFSSGMHFHVVGCRLLNLPKEYTEQFFTLTVFPSSLCLSSQVHKGRWQCVSVWQHLWGTEWQSLCYYHQSLWWHHQKTPLQHRWYCFCWKTTSRHRNWSFKRYCKLFFFLRIFYVCCHKTISDREA